MAATSDMDTRSRAEVVDLHRFFESWLRGELGDDDEHFERLTRAVAPSFEMIAPEGKRSSRDEVLTRIRGSHGRLAGEDFRITIEAYRGRPLSENLHLVTYEEWQEHGGQRRGRLSTAVLERAAEKPNGVRWLHVHETWLPE